MTFSRLYILAAVLLLAACATHATEGTHPPVDNGAQWIATCKPDDAWDKAGPPFHIYGDTYYVGTCGITAVMIAGDKGLVIIDGGPRNGGPLIAANVEALGFRMKDVKILLHTHEHHDHVGGLAYLQEQSGARVIASRAAAPVLESGVTADDDPQAGRHAPFAPVEVSGIVEDGDTVTLGDLELTAVASPGHTHGALTWTWRACEGQDCKSVVYMDSFTSVSADSYRFSDHPDYVAQFKASLAKVKALPCDIALTPHPAAGAMFERIASDVGLIDDAECRLYIEDMEASLDKRLERERAAAR